MKIGIAGYGLLGRLLSLALVQYGFEVAVFDPDLSGRSSSAFVAAGMLCPYSEIDAPAKVFQWGQSSIAHWLHISQAMATKDWLATKGSLVVAHPQEHNRLTQFISKLKFKSIQDNYRLLDQAGLAIIEPELQLTTGIYFENEGVIDTRKFICEIDAYLKKTRQVTYHEVFIQSVLENQLVGTNEKQYEFDWVIDSRGMGAQKECNNLRGVRGEVIHLYAPDVNLARPIRMLHPRYHLYIVPRANHHYIIGASEIESEDVSEITVRSTLELLTAAFSIHRGFAEARIIDTKVGLRPTFPNHLPFIQVFPGKVSVNGLYRHGYLLAPIVVHKVIDKLLEIGGSHVN